MRKYLDRADAAAAFRSVDDAVARNDLRLGGADGVDSSAIGRVVIAPIAVSPFATRADLQDKHVALLRVQNAPPGAPLADGFYEIRVGELKDGGLEARFVANGVVAASTDNVRLVPTDAQLPQPEAIIVEGSATIFLAGVVVGMALVILLQK